MPWTAATASTTAAAAPAPTRPPVNGCAGGPSRSGFGGLGRLRAALARARTLVVRLAVGARIRLRPLRRLAVRGRARLLAPATVVGRVEARPLEVDRHRVQHTT